MAQSITDFAINHRRRHGSRADTATGCATTQTLLSPDACFDDADGSSPGETGLDGVIGIGL
jgi:hypothetical protein